MKKLGFFISILLLVCKSNYAQVQTGAISIYNICGNFGVDGGGCNLSAMYAVFAPMTLPNATNHTLNCGTSAGCPLCGTGADTKEHIQAYISVWIPPTCVVNIVTEYGAPFNVNAACIDSRAENDGGASNRPDALCINNGSALSVNAATPCALADKTAAEAAGALNIGICSAGAAGLNTATLNGGATGLNGAPLGSACWLTAGLGNANMLCSANGFAGAAVTGTWATMWYMANRSDEIMTYTITPTSGAGTCTNIGVIVLPIELLNFVAYKTASDIQLGWTTATEINNNYFMVEYSLDATTFIPYKEIKGAGNSVQKIKYSCPFTAEIGNATPYFRLKQVDYNGNFRYSPIIRLGTSYGVPITKDLNLIAYYNTDKDKIIGKFHLDSPQEVNITLYDISGSKISDTNKQLNEGDNEIVIASPETAGVYLLVYQSGDNTPVHKKIIVSK